MIYFLHKLNSKFAFFRYDNRMKNIKIPLIFLLLFFALALLLGALLFWRISAKQNKNFENNPNKNSLSVDTNESQPAGDKIYVDNDFRRQPSKMNTYLESLAPLVVYGDKKNSGISINAVPFRETGEFVGLTFEGKEVILDIPKVDLFRVSNIIFDKVSDAVYLIESRYDSNLKTQVGTLKKIDIKNKKISTLADSMVGGMMYVDNKILAINEYGVAGEAVIQLYDVNTREKLLPRSYVKSNEYQTEYRIALNGVVYQIVFDNYGGEKPRTVQTAQGPREERIRVSSDSMKVHFRKIGNLNQSYIQNQNIPAGDYLRSVYEDQKNTSLYYTNTTGDIWPRGTIEEPKLNLSPTTPTTIACDEEVCYRTYYTMGHLYRTNDGKFAQVIGNGLVTFDIADMSVKWTADNNVISNVLLNSTVVAPVVNYIESADTPAGCGNLIGSPFEYPRVIEGRNNSWFAYCLR
ncbi:MAG: hypothetical protein UX98_C0011G0011 [Parcubacteria group bacterium GW2011_GWA2_47_26]|nr:MAG: hypothetical protein UX98_C0011G0011 [Parcubacteria group bacterium GW2011_GWA2_47_26]